LIASDSLDGWSGDLDSWTVQDGTLIGRADGTLKANRFIVADIAPVQNFEILVDVWVSQRGNSGIQYRGERREDLGKHVVTGYQCDVVAANPRYNGMLYEERGRRILAYTGQKVVIDPQGQPWVTEIMPVQKFKPESWHTYRVLVRGNRHQHWIDDHPTADVVDLDETNRSLTGVIGFQVHVGPPMEIRYRNLKLRRLPDDLPLRSLDDTPIPQTAEKVVPQGGWKKSGDRDANKKLEDVSETLLPNGHRAGPVELAGQLTQDQIRMLPDRQITTVITLQGENELTWDEKSLVESLGMKFVAIPITGPGDITNPSVNQVRQILKSARSDDRVLLHCASANRVGAFWWVHRVKDGRMELELARQEARKVGLRSPALEAAAKDILAK
jgi:protein tyrosine phosphatase (PTP) superfamily phosphohydrolase (DUF442 family)